MKLAINHTMYLRPSSHDLTLSHLTVPTLSNLPLTPFSLSHSPSISRGKIVGVRSGRKIARERNNQENSPTNAYSPAGAMKKSVRGTHWWKRVELGLWRDLETGFGKSKRSSIYLVSNQR